MIEPSDDVIEHATVREVAGVFRSRRDLEATVEALQRAGFDRADIDALSNIRASYYWSASGRPIARKQRNRFCGTTVPAPLESARLRSRSGRTTFR